MLRRLTSKASLLKQFSPRYFSAQAQLIKPSVNVEHTQLFIDGQFVNSVSGKTFETVDPRNGLPITQIAEGDKADIDLAVSAARRAFDEGPWPRLGGFERSKMIYRLAELLEQNKDTFAQLETWDSGKPLFWSGTDLNFGIEHLRYFAGWADKIQGKTIPMNTTFGYFDCRTYHEPIGVIGAIIPWNFPLLMAIWKMGPALAMGCTIVIKSAESTPLTSLAFGRLCQEAGIPDGVVNFVPGFGETAGRALSSSKGIDKIAFTGETTTGIEIMKQAADNLIPTTLELGGKSPAIVFSDADIEQAAHWLDIGLFLNAGQCCNASSRIYVDESVYDEFVERVVEKASQRVVGDPFDPSGVDQGPQQNEQQFNKVMEYINIGKEEGANCVLGGNRIGDSGYFCEPTIFKDVTDNMRISREEIFGPVMQISKFNERDNNGLNNIISRANDSNYGLAAGVFTQNNSKALQVSRSLKAGTVWVNCYDIFDGSAPFGGYKQSGIGREKGEYALKNFTQVKCVINKMDDCGTWY